MSDRAVRGHPVWDEIAPEITPHEFRNPYEMSVDALRRLSRVRRASKVPFRFVSDYRAPSYNEQVGGASGSAHTARPCHAVDLRVQNSYERFQIVKHALAAGYRRIGIYPPTDWQRQQYGKNSGSVHLDDSQYHPQDVIWVSV